MQTKVERRQIQSSRETRDMVSQSGTTLQGSIPNSVMLSMMGIQEHAQAQIPEAESEADRLSGSVTEGSPEMVKAAMGRRMGADFSNIRFHTDSSAATKANAMGARAYTSGRDIYFGEGGFDPSVAAHELVHTAQQGVVDGGVSTISTPTGGVQRTLSERQKQKARQGDRSNLTEIYHNDKNFYSELQQNMGRHLQQNLGPNPADSLPRLEDNKYNADQVKALVRMLAPTKKEMLDPVLRDAISGGKVQAIQDGQLQAAIGDEMNHQIIADSMKLVDPDLIERGSVRRDLRKLGEHEAALAEQAGRDMAHIMLNMQLGHIKINTSGNPVPQEYGNGMAYDPSMASLIAYGGRTIMDFGKTHVDGGRTTNANDVYRSMMELDQGNSADIAHEAKTSRWNATHFLDRDGTSGRLIERHGTGAWFSALGPWSGFKHRGFNPAIGGAGQVGFKADDNAPTGTALIAGGHTIKADGVNGHMYLGIKDSDENNHGGMMVGLETSESGKTNLTGKTHDFRAQKAPFSAVGGNKSGIIGDEYGGRVVDLTRINMAEQVRLHQMLTQRLANLASAAQVNTQTGTPAQIQAAQNARNQYNDIMERLSGKKMTPVELVDILAPNADERDGLLEIITRARQPAVG